MQARFVRRVNRFVLEAEVEGERVRVYLRNPGRLRELLLPGVELALEPGRGALGYHAVAVMDEAGLWVPLDTLRCNGVVKRLLAAGRLPGFEGLTARRGEVTVGSSRFDFELSDGSLLEVKSCTLAGARVAAFPDAVTARGRRHLEELRGRVLFVVHRPDRRWFVPDVHTDLAFSRALLASRGRVAASAVSVAYAPGLEPARVLPLEIPWELVEREAQDRGAYLVLLSLDRDLTLAPGRLGRREFPAGFYLYAGSARRGLTARVERHRRLRKRLHWHLDYLRQEARFEEAFPLRTADDLECALARDFARRADATVAGFGCSDCSCESHLLHFREDPRRERDFWGRLLWWRYDRLFSGSGRDQT